MHMPSKKTPIKYLVVATIACLILFCPIIACGNSATPNDYAALKAVVQDLLDNHPDSYPQGRIYLEQLEALERQAASTNQEIDDALRRTILTANPHVAQSPILFVTRKQYKPDHHNTETMFQTNEINTGSFEGGSALKILDLQQGPKITTLLESQDGVIRDPEVHFDGTRILFSMRQNIEDDYSIYEINADGTGLRRLTHTPGVSDIDPLYLPNDDIVFSSSREPKYCMCNRHIMCNLYRMTPDGGNIHQIGKNTLFEGHGALLPDGRILYDRWEYVDRNFGDAQGLWTVYPDGTNHAVFWGNNTQSPGAVIDARPIPGTQQVLCVLSSCHDRPWGALAIIDPRLGLDGAYQGKRSPSVIRTWPESAIELVGEGDPSKYHIDVFTSVHPKYEDPYPLSDKYFLCSRAIGKGEMMGICLVDVFGNELLLYSEEEQGETHGCFDPMPLMKQKRPPQTPTRRKYDNSPGYFYIADVYQGAYMQGVQRGAAKYLRVVESPEKRTFTGPAWEGQGQHAPAMNWHDFNNKRILGTVPVREDGSAYFAVPSDAFVYFQLLDEEGMMIQSMRSGTMIQAGETQGCIGCHEDRRTSAPTAEKSLLTALKREPDTLAPWYGSVRNFSFRRDVQPVLDRYCVSCHDYNKEAGKTLNLAGDRDIVFNTAYNELWRKKYIAAIGGGPAQVQPAYSWGARPSKLMKVLDDEAHRHIDMDPESRNCIATWIDINAPYYPEYESAFPDNLAGRSPLDDAQITRLSELTGVNFSAQMGHHSNKGPLIAFDRPTLSPCLKQVKKRNKDAYREALEIIKEGAKKLKQTPDADEEGFILAPQYQERLNKYDNLKKIELENRMAIHNGAIRFDGDSH